MYRFVKVNALLFSATRRGFRARRGYEPPNIEPSTYPHFRWQVPTFGMKPYSERVQELKPVESQESVDIGLPYEFPKHALDSSKGTKRIEFEKEARKRTLLIDLDDIHHPNNDLLRPIRVLNAARHFGIFDDLFGSPHFFVPQIPLELHFSDIPVKFGNKISPSAASSMPHLNRDLLPRGHLWTVIMTSPDEPLQRDESSAVSKEYLHWAVCNVNPDDDNSGDIIASYMQPIPYVGTGFHRYAFVLYRQDKGPIESTKFNLKVQTRGDPNINRSFSTREFYRNMEDQLTPAGLAFFQSAWDESVRKLHHQVLEISEPIFEMEWAEELPSPQARHPRPNSWNHPRRHPEGHPYMTHRLALHEDVSFDVYLDRYRDRKEMMQEIVEERLKHEGNPLSNDDRQECPFPMAIPMPENFPSWRVAQEHNRRLRKGRWRELDGHNTDE